MEVFNILLKSTNDPELSLFLSSLAASNNVESMGNSISVTPNLILKHYNT